MDAGVLAQWVPTLSSATAFPDLKALACLALSRLSEAEAAAAAPNELDAAVVAVVAALREHGSSHAKAARYGCAALERLVRRSAACHAAARAGGGLEAVVAALRSHPNYDGAAGEGCSALVALFRGDAGDEAAEEATQRAAGAAGAVEAVVAALRAHPQNVAVQFVACDALSCLLAGSAPHARAAAAAGGWQAVVAAMRNHAADVDVQLWALRALGYLVSHSDDDEGAAAPPELADEATRAVVAVQLARRDAAIEDNDGSAEVQLQGECCYVLDLLIMHADEAADGPQRRAVAGAAGAVRAVLAALRMDAADARLQQHGCAALASVCSRDARNEADAVAAGALDVVAAALRAHRACVDVQRAGVSALSCMGTARREERAARWRRCTKCSRRCATTTAHPPRPMMRRRTKACSCSAARPSAAS